MLGGGLVSCEDVEGWWGGWGGRGGGRAKGMHFRVLLLGIALPWKCNHKSQTFLFPPKQRFLLTKQPRFTASWNPTFPPSPVFRRPLLSHPNLCLLAATSSPSSPKSPSTRINLWLPAKALNDYFMANCRRNGQFLTSFRCLWLRGFTPMAEEFSSAMYVICLVG